MSEHPLPISKRVAVLNADWSAAAFSHMRNENIGGSASGVFGQLNGFMRGFVLFENGWQIVFIPANSPSIRVIHSVLGERVFAIAE